VRSVLVSVAAVVSIAARQARHLRSPLFAAGMSALLLCGCAADHSHGDDVRSARVHIPRPAQALLIPPKEPVCTPSSSGLRTGKEQPEAEARVREKRDGAERSSGSTEPGGPRSRQTPQRDPGSAQGHPDASLSQRIRLEFELNCFQQAEMRARAQLLQLQAAVGKTIRSLDRMKSGEAAGRPSGP
jgi:hypothetical protein